MTMYGQIATVITTAIKFLSFVKKLQSSKV